MGDYAQHENTVGREKKNTGKKKNEKQRIRRTERDVCASALVYLLHTRLEVSGYTHTGERVARTFSRAVLSGRLIVTAAAPPSSCIRTAAVNNNNNNIYDHRA